GSYALEQSPRGLAYVTMPAADVEGWKRVQAVAPFMLPVRATNGAGLSKENPVESAVYPYPILHTFVDRKDDAVYAMTRAMDETYSMYKDSAPGNDGWALDRQNLDWVIPYPDGAIRYYKEKGM